MTSKYITIIHIDTHLSRTRGGERRGGERRREGRWEDVERRGEEGERSGRERSK